MRTGKIASERKRALQKIIKENSRKEDPYVLNRKTLANDKPVDIHVNVETLYHPLSIPDQRLLNSEIFDFIEDSANPYAYVIPIRTVLHGVPEKEREQTAALMKEHYESVMRDQLRDRKTNTLRILCMLVLGLLFLCLYLILALGREGSVSLEILSVISSFALWDVANSYLIDRRGIKQSLLKTAQFLSMGIRFDE